MYGHGKNPEILALEYFRSDSVLNVLKIDVNCVEDFPLNNICISTSPGLFYFCAFTSKECMECKFSKGTRHIREYNSHTTKLTLRSCYSYCRHSLLMLQLSLHQPREKHVLGCTKLFPNLHYVKMFCEH